MQHLAIHLHLDSGLGEQLAALALLHPHGVVEDPEWRRVGLDVTALDEQLEGRLGALEGEAIGLQLLDELRQLLGVHHAVEAVAELLGADARVGLAAQLGYDQAALVADQGGVDMLVAALDLGHRRTVDAALVGEGAARPTNGW